MEDAHLYPFPLLALFFFKSGHPCISLTFFSASSQRACSLGLLSMRNKAGDVLPSPAAFPSEANIMLWNSDFRGVMSHNDQTKLQKNPMYMTLLQFSPDTKGSSLLLSREEHLQKRVRDWRATGVGGAVWLFCSRRTRRMEVEGLVTPGLHCLIDYSV